MVEVIEVLVLAVLEESTKVFGSSNQITHQVFIIKFWMITTSTFIYQFSYTNLLLLLARSSKYFVLLAPAIVDQLGN
jgi:hypothetical protein